MTKWIEKEILSGKPYGGLIAATSIVLQDDNENMVELAKQRLAYLPDGLEWRNHSIIYRPSVGLGLFKMNATIGIKGIIWGRAFKVQRYFQKHRRRKKKVWFRR